MAIYCEHIGDNMPNPYGNWVGSANQRSNSVGNGITDHKFERVHIAGSWKYEIKKPVKGGFISEFIFNLHSSSKESTKIKITLILLGFFEDRTKLKIPSEI